MNKKKNHKQPTSRNMSQKYPQKHEKTWRFRHPFPKNKPKRRKRKKKSKSRKISRVLKRENGRNTIKRPFSGKIKGEEKEKRVEGLEIQLGEKFKEGIGDKMKGVFSFSYEK